MLIRISITSCYSL